jgi:hypothetical protein
LVGSDWQEAVRNVHEMKKNAVVRLQQAKRDFANAQSQQAAERAEQETKDAAVALEESKSLQEPPPPPENDEEEEQEIPEIFFTSPQELLDKYKELESKNLFLIQNIQACVTQLPLLLIHTNPIVIRMHTDM